MKINKINDEPIDFASFELKQFEDYSSSHYPSISFAKKCGFTFRDIQKKEDTTYHIYAHTFPKRKTPSAGKASKSSMKSYDDYQKNPDTSVYGKRYSC